MIGILNIHFKNEIDDLLKDIRSKQIDIEIN